VAWLRRFGSYVPERRVGNGEIAARIGKDAAWIQEMTGIEERRWAADGESVADMGVEAARTCLDGDARPGLVLVSSGTSPRRFPGPAAVVAQRLGLAGVPAVDLPVASAGAVFAMALGCDLSPVYGDVLVVASEKMSEAVDREPMDPSSGMLFGDGAGACLISQREGGWRVVSSVLHSDGSMADLIQLPLRGGFAMDGMGAIAAATRRIPAVIQEAFARCGRDPKDTQQFVLHQANQNLLVRVARALEVPAERMYTNIRRYGNTSSASMLIAAAEAGPSGNLVCFAGFGAGLHWGAVVAEQAA